MSDSVALELHPSGVPIIFNLGGSFSKRTVDTIDTASAVSSDIALFKKNSTVYTGAAVGT